MPQTTKWSSNGHLWCRLELGDCYIGSSNPIEAGLDSKSGTMPPCLKKILLRHRLLRPRRSLPSARRNICEVSWPLPLKRARSAREFHRVWSPRGPWARLNCWNGRQLESCGSARPDPGDTRSGPAGALLPLSEKWQRYWPRFVLAYYDRHVMRRGHNFVRGGHNLEE